MRGIFLIALLATAAAQAQQTKSFVGTVSSVKADGAVIQLEVKPDGGKAPSEAVRITAATVAQKVAPGETTLKNAVAASVSELATGDRVLITMDAGTTEARRIVIMSAADLGKRDEADREDWNKRGISGVVAGRQGDTITLRARTMQGEVRETVTVSPQTKFSRYAPDSVKFADAQPSKLSEISEGDQLRARGEKSADGSSVKAEEVVFGTFLTTAGKIASVHAAAREVTITEMGSGKTLTVRLAADSRIKAMPEFAAPGAPAGAPGGHGPLPGGFPGGGFPGGAPAGGGLPPGMPPGGLSIAQMVETMPAAAVEDLKPNQTVVISSTKGAASGTITAIMLVANADMLIRAAQAGQGRGPANGGNGAGALPGAMPGLQGGDLGGLLGGFGLPGMGP